MAVSRSNHPHRWSSDLHALPDPLPIPTAPADGFHLRVRPPGSKSLTNRALLLAALSEGESVLRGALLDADDAQRMLIALGALGVRVRTGPDGTLRVIGRAGRLRAPRTGAALNLNNAGTATRFLSAAACLANGPVTIDGNPRMRARPIGELAHMLRRLGARVQELGNPGCVPLRIDGSGVRGGDIEIPTTLSSQFVSAILMIAPWLPGGVRAHLVGEVTSPSYIRMTLELMRTIGASVTWSEDVSHITVNEGGLRAFELAIEPDASAAVPLWCAAALCPGSSCIIEGVGTDSLQGDARFADVLERMGASVERRPKGARITGPRALRAGHFDLSDMPDAAMSLSALCCFADGPSTIRGLRTLRVKETDRLEAVRTELSKAGAMVQIVRDGRDEGLRIEPIPAGRAPAPIVFDTYDDHRMAMSTALVGLRLPGVWVRDPGCVAKTYSNFWRDLSGVWG